MKRRFLSKQHNFSHGCRQQVYMIQTCREFKAIDRREFECSSAETMEFPVFVQQMFRGNENEAGGYEKH